MNAKPLTFAIENGLVEHDFGIVQTPPSELSGMLFNKDIDLGLIPVAEFLKRRTYRAVPDVSISSFGKVDSVVLLTKGDIGGIKSVAVDRRSQSSTALLRIILEIFHGLSPVYSAREVDDGFLSGVDGGMIIGDSGLMVKYAPPPGYRVHDLGEIWTEKTGLPFVFAVLAVNGGVGLGKNLESIRKSKEYGAENIKMIAKLESERLGINESICFTYLSGRIKYDLGEREIAGIIKYSELLSELGISEKISGIDIYTE